MCRLAYTHTLPLWGECRCPHDKTKSIVILNLCAISDRQFLSFRTFELLSQLFSTIHNGVHLDIKRRKWIRWGGPLIDSCCWNLFLNVSSRALFLLITSYFDDDDERNSIFLFFFVCVCLLSEGDTILTGVAVPWRLLTRTVMSFSFFEIRASRARRACIMLSVRAIIIYFFSEWLKWLFSPLCRG